MKFNGKDFLQKNKEGLYSKNAKIGGYSFAISAMAAGILVAVNVFASVLPTNLTQFDITAQRLYSVTSNTKAVVNNMEQEVTIYWIVQNGQEDDYLEKLLNVYDSLSDKVTVEKRNPDVYPTFATKYTDETVTNNSLVVESGDKSRYIPYADIYSKVTTSNSYASTSSISYTFNGESEITSAINYVIAESLPQIYLTDGHGESGISDSFFDSLTHANMETQSFTLVNVDEIPEDASVVWINAPTSDFSEEEVQMLASYVENGGKLFVTSGPQDGSELPNLDSLMEAYGVTFNEGIVMEQDRNYYGFSYPYILLPTIESTEITDDLLNETSYVLVPLAAGMTIDAYASDATVTSLLTTSDTSFSKVAGYDMSTVDKEDGDIDGPFSVAVSVENASEGKIVWVSSDTLVSAELISYSSGTNADFAMNALSWMTGETSGVAVATKSMDYSYLTITESQATRIKIVTLAVLPILYLVFGIDEALSRRKKA